MEFFTTIIQMQYTFLVSPRIYTGTKSEEEGSMVV